MDGAVLPHIALHKLVLGYRLGNIFFLVVNQDLLLNVWLNLHVGSFLYLENHYS